MLLRRIRPGVEDRGHQRDEGDETRLMGREGESTLKSAEQHLGGAGIRTTISLYRRGQLQFEPGGGEE